MPIRLIALDMDGTLLSPAADGQLAISPACLAALRAAQASGIHLALCSGRMADDAGCFARDAGLPMHILSLNGGCCQLEPMGSFLFARYLPGDAALRLNDLLRASGLLYGIFGKQELIISRRDVSDEDIRLHWGTHLTRPDIATRIRTGGSGAEELCHNGACKLLVLSEEGMTVLGPLRERIERCCPEVEVSSSWGNNLELNPRGVHKGTGLRQLADHLGIPMTDVMAVGDQDNDLPMLRCAFWSVAMGNGTPAVLQQARYLTAPCTEDGAAEAILGLALGRLDRKVRCIK